MTYGSSRVVQVGEIGSSISIVLPGKGAVRVAPHFPEPFFILIQKDNLFHPLRTFPGIALRDNHADRASVFLREGPAVPFVGQEHVLFKSFDDYTTNLPLEACDDTDVLLTYKWNGRPLTKEPGGPVRVIVPKRYAWKGAKWVKEITFSEKDEKGFWEVRGYSNNAFPWENDRYG